MLEKSNELDRRFVEALEKIAEYSENIHDRLDEIRDSIDATKSGG